MFRMIAFEGIDGAGKTTISKLLFEFLKKEGYNVILTQEPFTNEIIELIKRVGWKDPILLTLLFSADRAYHINWIRQQNPEIVIMDRYYYSTIAYQSVLGVEEEWILNINSKFPKPDLVFLLDIDEEEAIKRIRKDDKFNFQEKISTLKLVRSKYLELARTFNFNIINTMDRVENIAQKVFSITCSSLNLRCS
ncbi:MAG: dTMP kinase [Sulfolobus sp.]|nr:dTMP kinase [Sulfolobus sp.]